MAREASASPALGALLLSGGSVETLLRRKSLGGGVRLPCPLCSSVACSSCACVALPQPCSSSPAASARRPSACGGHQEESPEAALQSSKDLAGGREPTDDFFEVDDLVSVFVRNASWRRVAVQLPSEMLREAPWLSSRLRGACKSGASLKPHSLAEHPDAGTHEATLAPEAAETLGAPGSEAPGGAKGRADDQLRKRIKMGMHADPAKQTRETGDKEVGEGDGHEFAKAAAVENVEMTRNMLASTTFFLLGDTVHSSCCADQIAASHIEPHALVHYGYSCLSWPVTGPAYPLLYRYTSLPLNVSHFSCSLCRHLKVYREQQLAAYREASLRRPVSPQGRPGRGADLSPAGRGPLSLVSSGVLGDGLSLSAALQSCVALRGRLALQLPPSTFRLVSTLGMLCETHSSPLVLVYDVRYHYALPCMLQHIAPLFLAPSPPSSISTTPPLSSPASATPPLHARGAHQSVESSEGGACSGASSPSVEAAHSSTSLQAAADALAAAAAWREDASVRGDRGRTRDTSPQRGDSEFGGDACLRVECAGSRMAVVGNAVRASGVREVSPSRDNAEGRLFAPLASSGPACATTPGDWQPTSLCVALAPSACLPSTGFDLRALEPSVARATAPAPRNEEEVELDPADLQRRHFASLVISFAAAESQASSGESPEASDKASLSSSSSPPPTWFFSLPLSWTPRLVFLGPQLQPAQRLVQQQAGGKRSEGISVRASGASLRISLSAYTAVAGRFVFQAFYRAFDRAIGLAPVIPLSASLRMPVGLKAPSPAGPEFVPIEEALGCGWGEAGVVGRERGDICLLYVGPTVDASPSEEQPGQTAGAVPRFTYQSNSHPEAYAFATAFATSGKPGEARVFEGNETLAGWQAYRELRGKLAPPPLLHRLLLRYGGVDRVQVLSYDPTFFTGPPNQEHLVQQFQKLQVCEQQRDEEDAELALSPDTTADEAEDLPEEGSRRRSVSRMHQGSTVRRGGCPSAASRQEEELTALEGVGEDEKEYFRASLCILDETDRASTALQKQFSRVTPLAETTRCTALLLLGPQVYGQPGVLAYVQRQLQKRSEAEARHVVRIAMGEVTPAKLLNFEEVDSACLFGCPELCLRVQQEQKARGLSQLLVLPIDALAATDEAFEWKPSRQPIEADELWQQITSQLRCGAVEIEARAAVAADGKREDDAAGASEERQGAGDAHPEKDKAAEEKAGNWKVALRGGSDVLQCVLGQDVLSRTAERHFKGVSFGEQGHEETGTHLPPAYQILQGLSGVASEYEKERHIAHDDSEKTCK
ncbi:diphthamide biosynthesis protein 2 [Toxoplasma gondii RUB]|uniref:Diphthamide biosynthesis protein 2 n=2 Tax=Toxoplasma gondii TaxID=5811 RepID=A0A086M7M7_TOXGO|nr:diphthamide biosynthesis protein 2 [Toxoplasma gondii RUB]KFH05094.1 diphthamide biosynthesis protein 2 [Toxoplasma gondii VAND]